MITLVVPAPKIYPTEGMHARHMQVGGNDLGGQSNVTNSTFQII